MQIGDEAEGFVPAFDLGAVDEVHLGQVGAGGDKPGDDCVAHVVFGIEPYDAALRRLSFVERKLLVCRCHGRKEGGDLALAFVGQAGDQPDLSQREPSRPEPVYSGHVAVCSPTGEQRILSRVAARIRIGGSIRVVFWIVAFVEAAIDLAYEPAPVLLRDAVGIPFEQIDDVVGAPVQLLEPTNDMVELVRPFAGAGLHSRSSVSDRLEANPIRPCGSFRRPARSGARCHSLCAWLPGTRSAVARRCTPRRHVRESLSGLPRFVHAAAWVWVVRRAADPVRLHGVARIVVTAERARASAELGRIADRQPFGEQDIVSVAG
jgi:hypothetical protein